MARERPMTAAGAVVWRRRSVPTDAPRGPGRQVELLLVHRPRYDDWTFPKGKPDPGEDLVATAVREVAEETGQHVRLGHPLPDTTYRVAAGPKRVSYWTGRVVAPTDPPFAPNREVDELRWVRPREARRLLTYDHDLDLLESFLALRDERAHRTRTLVVVRHGKALARDDWAGDDATRPLVGAGERRAADLALLLSAYGVRRLVSSPAARCVATLEPFAAGTGTLLELDERLAEGTRPSHVEWAVAALTASKVPTALCTHRPTLPWVLGALGVEDPGLAPGEGVVVHHRRGRAVRVEPLGRRTSDETSVTR